MGYQKTLVILLSLVLCVHTKNWYLANDNGSFEGLFKSHNIQKEGKIKIFSPMSTEEHPAVNKNNNSNSFRNYISIVSDFKPLNKVTLTSEIPENMNNYVKNNNLIGLNKRKVVQPKYTQSTKIHKSFKSNAILHSRFLDIFEVIEFDHVSCFSVDGLEGTCLHEYDCQKIGGITTGTYCADGYGTCCVSEYRFYIPPS